MKASVKLRGREEPLICSDPAWEFCPGDDGYREVLRLKFPLEPDPERYGDLPVRENPYGVIAANHRRRGWRGACLLDIAIELEAVEGLQVVDDDEELFGIDDRFLAEVLDLDRQAGEPTDELEIGSEYIMATDRHQEVVIIRGVHNGADSGSLVEVEIARDGTRRLVSRGTVTWRRTQ